MLTDDDDVTFKSNVKADFCENIMIFSQWIVSATLNGHTKLGLKPWNSEKIATH